MRKNVAIASLVALNVITAAILRWQWHESVSSRREVDMWEHTVRGVVSLAATLQALEDWRQYSPRFYVLMPDSSLEGTGQFKGDLEVWSYPCHRMLGRPGRLSSELFVESYNRKIRQLAKSSAQDADG